MVSKTARIHMNGRVYDPNLGRFLSVDPVFEFPTNTQSLNPYSYVLNNPLSLTDPTGYVAQDACPSGSPCANKDSSQAYGQGSGESSRITQGHQSATGMKFRAGVRALGKFAKQAKGVLGKALTSLYKNLVANGAKAFQNFNDAQNIPNDTTDIGSEKQNSRDVKTMGFIPFFIGTIMCGCRDATENTGEEGVNPTGFPGEGLMFSDIKGVALLGIIGRDAGKSAVESATSTLARALRRAPEFSGGEITESSFLNSVEHYLGKGYKEVSSGRYVSEDGLRQVRFGSHEVRSSPMHAHFEAYDKRGGRVIENTQVIIKPDNQ